MSDEIIKRDENRVTVLAGVTDDAAQEIRMLRVDPATGRLKLSMSGIAVAATVDVGTTTNGLPGTNAIVTNVGTTSAAIFDFTIPVGSVIYSTFGIPLNTVGVDGDWAFDTSVNAYVYYKSGGAWAQVNSLRGPQGIQGVAGPIGLTWKGAYNNATAYIANDGVSYNGSSYINILAGTGFLPTDGTHWNLIAQKGADGIGSGDVMGPATNTADYIPQWNGANSKTLKDGLAVPAGGLAGITLVGTKLDTSAFTDTAVTSKLLTGFTSGAGTVAGTDTILQGIQKLNGNDLLKLPLAGGTMTGGITNSTSINPLTTLAESWIGPSSTTGVYFKGGNVGIGTTTPGDKLVVVGGGIVAKGPDATATSTYLNSEKVRLWASHWDGTASLSREMYLQLITNSATDLDHRLSVFSDSGLPLMSITNGGNVGIGTTAPGFPLVVEKDALAATPTTSTQLQNATLSTAIATQQFSPSLQFTGHAWNTTAVAADNQLDARNYLGVTSGATPSSTLFWGFQRAGGGYTDQMNLTSAGVLTVPSIVSALTGNASTATALNSIAVASSGITMNTAKMLGRATAGVGAIEEIATTGTGSAVLATSPTFQTSINGAYLNASEILVTDASKNIVSLPVATYPSLTELSYVKGVTSSLQTQLNAKGVGDMTLAGVQSVTGLKTFDTTKLAIKGSSTGTTAIASANSSATSYTAILPAKDITVAGTVDIPVKATGAEVATGTDDTKFVTPLAIKNSVNVPNVAPGTSGNVMTSNGSAWVSSTPSGSAPNVQTFTTTGANTWTKPTGAKFVVVTLIGGGGAGAGNNGTTSISQAGGGGGGLSNAILVANNIPSSVTVTVGGGGVGNGTGTGGSGGNTTFGSSLTAGGGGGGSASSSGGTGGTGGTSSGGANGGSGGTGEIATWPSGGGGGGAGGGNGANGGSGGIFVGGAGGTAGNTSSLLGAGGTGGAGGGSGNNGVSGFIYGGGGGGSSVGATGGNGYQGYAIITTYF